MLYGGARQARRRPRPDMDNARTLAPGRIAKRPQRGQPRARRVATGNVKYISRRILHANYCDRCRTACRIYPPHGKCLGLATMRDILIAFAAARRRRRYGEQPDTGVQAEPGN